MTREDWDTVENIKNDYTELRCGNRTTRDQNFLEQQFLAEQCQAQAQYPGQLVWKVYRTWR